MTSLVLQACVFEVYGARLDTKALAKVLNLAEGTVRNKISDGSFPVPTYLDNGTRYADFRDVAQHLEHCRALASSQRPDRPGLRA